MSHTDPAPAGGAGLLARVADGAFVHRRRVLLGWLAALVLAIAAMATVGGSHVADYNTPGSDSEAASKLLDERFAGRSGDQVDVVWTAQESATAPNVQARIDRLLDEAAHVPGIVDGASARAAQVSPDGRTAVVRLPLDRPSSAMEATDGERLADLAEQTAGDGVQVALGGNIPGLKTEPAMTAELVGVAVAALVLLLTFGTVVAAGLPLLVALFGVAVAVLLGGVLAAVLDTPDWSLQVSLMIGIGVGIDYALLILTRYRAAVRGGKEPRAANVEAMTTAGHSVLTAGATVVVSLAGLFLMRLPYLYGVALASSLAVLIVMAAAITLLPAVLGVLSRRIDRWQVLRFGRPLSDTERAPAARWARLVTGRPLAATVVSIALLAVLTSPLTGIRFDFPASSVDQSDVTAARLPLFIGAVVLLSFALLVAAFRAPLIALKASVLTVFSIAAAYGVVALVAEGGWAGQLVGIDTDVPVPPFIPVMMFAVLFGLSMDYEVFLVSRIKEERERLEDARAGVTAGVAMTARVIVAAAAIMVSVFGAFALSPDVLLKLIGIGLAAAILIDAVVVRMMLVPALMRLLGERAWWTPRRWARPPAADAARP